MPKNILNEDVNIGKILHEWNVTEYEQHQRNLFWYVFMVIIGVFLIGYALITGNFLFAIVIVLFAIIIFLQSQQKPYTIPFRITVNGVVVNNRFYPYSEFDNFYVIYHPPEVKSLFLETSSNMRPKIRVPIEDIDPNEIRFTLREFMIEDVEKESEPFSDMIARRWLFH